MAFSVCKSLFWFSLPVLLAVLTGYALHFHAPPAFDVATLARVAAEARLKFPEPQGAGVTAEDRLVTLQQTVAFISSELSRAYPQHIHPNQQWITNLAGGFKTGMLILHASLTEYVMIWGSQLDTTGHSGRNLAEFHDFLLSGQGKWWGEGQLGVKVATARNEHAYMHTPYLSGGIVQLQNGTWMLEYCRGIIPALLPFGVGDTIFSSMDLVTLYRSLKAYGTLTVRELLENGKV